MENSKCNVSASVMEGAFSVSPEGERFPLPEISDYEREFHRLKKLVSEQRLKGGRSWW